MPFLFFLYVTKCCVALKSAQRLSVFTRTRVSPISFLAITVLVVFPTR